MLTPQEKFTPYLVAVNLTASCNLACAHCYMDADQRGKPASDELDNAELAGLFQEIAERAPGTIIVLTGGEPLLRPDLPLIVASGAKAGLRMVLGTNGLLLTPEKISLLKTAGLQGVGVSLDAVEPSAHDEFRGVPGAFARARQGIKNCRAQDLHVQIHFTLTRKQLGREQDVVSMARELGASIVNFFFLVCVGRGQSAMDLTPEEYENALIRIARLQRDSREILVQSRCTPHFKRILYETDPQSEFTRATGYDGGGCPAATHYCRITPKGDMTPCPYLELSGGNIKEKGFWKIWDEARLFQSFRDPSLLQGRCGSCEYKLICGGCRARSLAETGNLMGEDPSCSYQPVGGETIPARLENGPEQVVWTQAARERLIKVPLFLRPMIRKKLEERALREGVEVTPELMQKHRSERQAQLGMRFG